MTDQEMVKFLMSKKEEIEQFHILDEKVGRLLDREPLQIILNVLLFRIHQAANQLNGEDKSRLIHSLHNLSLAIEHSITNH